MSDSKLRSGPPLRMRKSLTTPTHFFDASVRTRAPQTQSSADGRGRKKEEEEEEDPTKSAFNGAERVQMHGDLGKQKYMNF